MPDSETMYATETYVLQPTEMSKTLSTYVLFFFVLTSFFWILGFSFNFSFLHSKGKRSNAGRVGGSSSPVSPRKRHADPGRTFVFAMLAAIVSLLVLWALGNKC
jgi:hypothetical protein